MKKLFALLLAVVMMMSLATVAFGADSKDAEYNKSYVATNTGTVSPAETFTIKYTPVAAIDAETGAELKNAVGEKVEIPAIANSTVTYAVGAANQEGAVQKITAPLSGIEWPYVGIYTYKVEEQANDTAGVVYDTATRYLKVTVAYDQGTNTYYTAFVTLELVEGGFGANVKEKTDTITNVYNAGVLKVKKTVTGNMGDQEKEFDVKVTFTAPEGKTVYSDIKYSDSNKDGVVDGLIAAGAEGWTGTKEVKIKVKHDETVTFTNIPYGVTYTVEEDSYKADGYETTYDANQKGKIEAASVETVITNDKNTNVDTGILMDSAPYVVMLLVAAAGLVLFTNKRRVQD